MARYHYAFYWTYGVGKKWDDGSWPWYIMVLIRGLSVTLGCRRRF